MADPIYTESNCQHAYQLNWSLSLFGNLPFPPSEQWSERLRQVTEPDGVRILEHRLKAPDVVQFLISTKPHVSPAEIIRSVKGRLQYLIRDYAPKIFRRNYRIESVGSAKRQVVDRYVAEQLGRHPMADDRVHQKLARFQIHCSEVDLSQVRFSAHGQFIHNLHVTLVNQGRWREIDDHALQAIREMIVNASKKKGYLLSRAGIVPDHVHLTLGCDIGESPQEVALSMMNNLAFAQGMEPIYQYGFYVGTFGNYDLGAIRQALR